MKELLVILEAIERARSALAYAQSGERSAEETLQELIGILDNAQLSCALEKVRGNIGSPPIAPDVGPVETSITG